MPDETSILNVLMEQMADTLSRALIDDVEGDDTQAGLVRAGKLQDDPTLTTINVLIHPGGTDYRDTLYTEQRGIRSPIYEIGGGMSLMRRFRVQLALYFDRELVRAIAREKALVVYSRAWHFLKTMPIPNFTDTFGEHANFIQVFEGYIFEGGGEGTFIWNGEIIVEVQTDHEYSYEE